MNINFCVIHCKKAMRPHKIVHCEKGESDWDWWLHMDTGGYGSFSSEMCYAVPIEDASELFEHVPKGWYKSDDGRQLYVADDEDISRTMFKVKLCPSCSTCPYLAEQTMYDIEHERRLAAWREHEKMRKKIIEGRKSHAKTDGSELP